jgi:hypothetical protein
MSEKWSILILTQPGREQFLARLHAVLRPQLEAHSDVKLTIHSFDRSKDLGTNRQGMIERAEGEFISWIDDDDLVPANYVSTIYPLLDGVDYVGFQLQMYIDGVKQKPTFHSLRYKEWTGDEQGWYRDISHLNPIRRKLALTIPMSGGNGEDSRWADGLRKLGIVKKEHYVDAVMYLYLYRSNKMSPTVPRTPLATSRTDPVHDPNAATHFPVGHRRPICPKCGSTACGIAGGMRRCNQCGASWI